MIEFLDFFLETSTSNIFFLPLLYDVIWPAALFMQQSLLSWKHFSIWESISLLLKLRSFGKYFSAQKFIVYFFSFSLYSWLPSFLESKMPQTKRPNCTLRFSKILSSTYSYRTFFLGMLKLLGSTLFKVIFWLILVSVFIQRSVCALSDYAGFTIKSDVCLIATQVFF